MPNLSPKELKQLQDIRTNLVDAEQAVNLHANQPNDKAAADDAVAAARAAKDAANAAETNLDLVARAEQDLQEAQQNEQQLESEIADIGSKIINEQDYLNQLENTLNSEEQKEGNFKRSLKNINISLPDMIAKRGRLEDAKETADAAVKLANDNMTTAKAAVASTPCQQQSNWQWVWGTKPDNSKSEEAKEKLVTATNELNEATEKQKKTTDDFEKQKDRIREKYTNKKKTQNLSKNSQDRLVSLNSDIQKTDDDINRLTKGIETRQNKIEETQSNIDTLTPLTSLQQTINNTRQAANTPWNQAAQWYGNNGHMDDRIILDTETGAIMANLNDNNATTALTAYKENPPTRGAKAKELAPILAGSNQAQFTARMNNANNDFVSRNVGTQTIYDHPDGTVVRYKPNGDAYHPNQPRYSVEVRINGQDQSNTPDDIAFKVDRQGKPVPKNLGDTNNPYPDGALRQEYLDAAMQAGHQGFN